VRAVISGPGLVGGPVAIDIPEPLPPAKASVVADALARRLNEAQPGKPVVFRDDRELAMIREAMREQAKRITNLEKIGAVFREELGKEPAPWEPGK
jgi:hypothetical protein